MHIRSDIERKAMFEVGAIERLGEAGYTEIANAEAYARMRRKAGLALAAGFGVIADAVYTAIEERQGIERIARDLSCEFAGFWLEAPLELRVGRVQTRQNDASDADASYLRRQPDAESNSLSWQRIEATSAASSDAWRFAHATGWTGMIEPPFDPPAYQQDAGRSGSTRQCLRCRAKAATRLTLQITQSQRRTSRSAERAAASSWVA